MTPLKTGALALTLILIIPILLGYGMATEEQEITVDKTTNGGQLTDLVLNANSPYFLSYTGTNNNSTLIRETYVNGGYETKMVSPTYIRSGDVYSSYPIMTSGSSTSDPVLTPTLNLGSSTSTTLSGATISETFSGSDYAEEVTLSGASGQLFVYNGLRPITGADSTNTLAPGDYTEIKFTSPYSFWLGNDSTEYFGNGTVSIVKLPTYSQIYGGNYLGITANGSYYTAPYIEFNWNSLYTIQMYTDSFHEVSDMADAWTANLNNVGIYLKDDDNNVYRPLNNSITVNFYGGGGEIIDGDTTTTFYDLYFATGYSTTFSYSEYPIYETSDMPDFDYAYFSMSSGTAYAQYPAMVSLEWTSMDTPLSNGSPKTAVRGGSGYYVGVSDVDTRYSDFRLVLTGDDVTMTYRTCATLSPLYDGDAVSNYSIDTNGIACVKITYGDSTAEYVAVSDLNSITYSYGLLNLGTSDDVLTYNGVSSVAISQNAATTTLDWTYQIPSGDYAEITYGWRIPSSSGVNYWMWRNGFLNNYLRLMVALEDDEQFSIGTEDDRTLLNPLVNVTNSSGIATVTINGNSTALGSYNYLMVELDTASEKITVSGLTKWGALGVYPQVNNQVSESYDLGYFTGIYLADITGHADYRVDGTRIQAGTYSTTVDCELNVYDYFPNDARQTVIIDSVGVYGDYLTIGGTQYTVTDGKITTSSGAELSVLSMKIYESYDSDTNSYTIEFGDEELTSASPSIVFGGEWSLTLHRTKTVSETSVQNNWVAGEFAFDQDDFLLAMILTSVAVFVGLGLMKGVRIGVLLVVCSAAGIIAFIIA